MEIVNAFSRKPTETKCFVIIRSILTIVGLIAFVAFVVVTVNDYLQKNTYISTTVHELTQLDNPDSVPIPVMSFTAYKYTIGVNDIVFAENTPFDPKAFTCSGTKYGLPQPGASCNLVYDPNAHRSVFIPNTTIHQFGVNYYGLWIINFNTTSGSNLSAIDFLDVSISIDPAYNLEYEDNANAGTATLYRLNFNKFRRVEDPNYEFRYSINSNTRYSLNDSTIITFIFYLDPAWTTEITELYSVTWTAVLGQIGGALGILGTVYGILFGASKINPWGVIQKCVPYKLLVSEDFEKLYLSQLVDVKKHSNVDAENVDETCLSIDPGSTSIVTTNEQKIQRLELLEKLLFEYYLDDSTIERLRRKYRKEPRWSCLRWEIFGGKKQKESV